MLVFYESYKKPAKILKKSWKKINGMKWNEFSVLKYSVLSGTRFIVHLEDEHS